MGACLSDQDLEVYVGGSATPEQMSAWNEHLDDCDSCAARLARKAAVRTVPPAPADPDENPGPGSAETITVKPPADAALDAGAGLPEDAIPGYRILKELHRGGQGVVYQAVQEAAKRKVALKVMLEGPFASKDAKRRFEREIALVGSLRHPGIVPIFDSGVAQERFYYAMEYIRGERLNEYVQSRKLSVDDTLRLFKKVCDAVDYAHQKGVIHRDLKPSNILADASGEPHVLDFGLAKVGGAEAGDEASLLVSVTGQVMGTLAYMSPEQAAGTPDQVDMRSDVYSLGVILYELLTGQLPYDLSGQMAENLTTIQQAEPRRPGTIRRQVNDEVETVVLKALSKDKQRRYSTAGNLGEDIGRLLAGEPIEAKRDSALYMLKKTLRRYKAPVAVVAAFLLLSAVGLVMSLTFWRQAAAERDRTRTAMARAEAINGFLRGMLTSPDPAQEGPDVKVVSLLDRADRDIDETFVDDPETQASLRATIGRVYLNLALFEPADHHLASARDIRRRILGEDHPDTLASQHDLADLAAARRAWPQAEQLYQQILNARRSALGDAHLDTLRSMHGLGVAQRRQGKLRSAKALLNDVLNARREVLHEEHPDVLVSMQELAMVLLFQGNLAEAATLQRRVLATQRELLGAEHPDTLDSMNDLAWMLNERRQWAQAESLARQALDTRRSRLGSEHSQTLASMGNLVAALVPQGKLAEAEALQRTEESIRRRVPGADYLGAQIEMGQSRARLLFAQGKRAEAEAAYRQLLAMHDRFAERYPYNLLFKKYHAWLLATCPFAELRDPARAVALAGECVRLSDTAAIHWNTLGIARYRVGRWSEAIEALEESLALDPDTGSLNWFFLAMAHEQQGENEQAHRDYDRAVKWMGTHQPDDDEFRRFRAEAAALLGLAVPTSRPAIQPVATQPTK